MKFIDELVIEVESGKGGDGMIAFRREKYVPMGGPSGGDGGNGGNVILKADPALNTLYELSFKRIYKAQPGEKGKIKDMTGANGEDCIINVPVGTLVYDDNTGEFLADLNTPDATFVAAKGGRGGRGNAKFVSSVRRAPRIAEKGEPGITRKLRLELKLLADVGLIGLPNAGKSTFLSVVSNATPKIADYPFTTLVPQLGIVKPPGCTAFCMADLPGLIKGAHLGAGLGIRFLKHIERTRILVHLVDLAVEQEKQTIEAFLTVTEELKAFSEDLAKKPMIVVGNKLDLPLARKNWPFFEKAMQKRNLIVKAISGVTKDGVDEVLKICAELLATIPKKDTTFTTEKIYRYEAPFKIERNKNGDIIVTGAEIERLLEMTDFTTDEGVQLFKKRLEKMGFLKELADLKGDPQDTVFIGAKEFYYEEFFQ